jgi:pimeloyl-ACP methyl ester carboxylesterase
MGRGRAPWACGARRRGQGRGSGIAATIPKVALEFSIAIDAPATLQDYAKIAAPTLLIAGSKTRAPARAVADLLAGALPNAKLAILKGAGHMSPFTHPAEINRMILDHLAAQR